MTTSLFDLTGRVAIVTGATSGLGQAMAEALAQAGARIVGVGSSGNFEDTKRAVEQAGGQFAGITADLSKMEAIPQIVQGARDAFGQIDILINNAGIIRRSPALEFTEADWDAVIQVDLKSVFFLAQAVARAFLEQKTGGKIINIASVLSYQGGILVAPYTASKSGLAGLTRLLANEWASQNINVNAIAPGYFATRATAAIQKDPVRNKSILDRIPAGRWGRPADLAGMVIFLASSASDYCHGTTYPVDGGWLGR